MKTIVAITLTDAGHGFGCCGAVQHAVAQEDSAKALLRVVADNDCGVVILDERLLEQIGEERLREIERDWEGVVVILPAPGAVTRDDDYAARLIRRAVGYHVRMRK